MTDEAWRPLLVFVGGGTGALLRYAVGRWAAVPADGFPWPTLGINVAGSLALGVLAGACHQRPLWLALLGTGVCGGFTTFSTFSVEAVRLADAGRPAAAAGYAAGSVLAAVAGAWVGLRAGR